MNSHSLEQRKEIDWPLIIIAGLVGVGKTSFVKRVQGVPFDRSSQLFKADSEAWWVKNLVCVTLDLNYDKLFQASGWEDYVPFANGLIFIIDGADPENLKEAYQWLVKAIQWTQPMIPILLLWNKSDLPHFIPFSKATAKIPSFSHTINNFPHIRIWEGSISQDQEFEVILDWFTAIAEYHLLAIPPRFQAFRVYFKAPELILAEEGRIDIFDTIFELIQQTLLSPKDQMRFIPLCGGNYVIWQASDLCHCIAIFPEGILPELGEITVSSTLALIEKRFQTIKRHPKQ